MKHILPKIILLLISFSALAQDSFNGCPMEGDAKGVADQNTNRLKNRYILPKPSDINPSITLSKMLAPGNDEGRFSESQAATITGYVVHVNKRGSSETCNCHETDPLFTDTHIELVIDQEHAAKKQRVIVEVTPRIRAMMADQGIDWTSDALQNLEGKLVSFTGWMLWDWRHLKDSENTDPDDPQNWRATSWELHPVTAIEILDNPLMETSEDESATTTPVYFTSSDNDGPDGINRAKFGNPPTQDPGEFLTIIFLSAILGMCGQVIRVMAGLKKVQNNATDQNDKKIKTILADNTTSIAFSLFIALVVGGVAGVLVTISSNAFVLDKSTVIALIASGYAGTDFIEGFIVKR
jgi:hypothetical protein